MKNDEEKDLARFDDSVSDRERAIFEGAITLGAIFHQFQGTPFREKEIIEDAMKESALTQPDIVDVEISLETHPKSEKKQFEYGVVSGEILSIEITAEHGEAQAIVGMEWLEEYEYPLMFIKQVIKNK